MDKFKEFFEEQKKQFGETTIFTIKDNIDIDIDVIPTGSIRLNQALGVGGNPRGRIIEIYGGEGSGKTTIALHSIAEAQKIGRAAFIDAEHALDPRYAKIIGVDMDSLVIAQPDCGEDGLEITESLVRSNYFSLIAIDSVAALVPRAEIEGMYGDRHMGLMARMMSQAMRKLTGIISKTNTVVIFINQTRVAGLGGGFTYQTTTGGNALKFYASVRQKVVKIAKVKNGDEIIGQRVSVEIIKNRLGIPFKKAEFDIRFGVGIDKIGEILDIAIEKNIIEKSGTWYGYDEDRLGQGRENTIQFLKENEKLMLEIKNKLEISGEQNDKKKEGRKEKKTKRISENSKEKR